MMQDRLRPVITDKPCRSRVSLRISTKTSMQVVECANLIMSWDGEIILRTKQVDFLNGLDLSSMDD